MKRYIYIIILLQCVALQALAYYGISPYAYCAGDPVNRRDVDGKASVFAEGSTWNFMYSFVRACYELNKVHAGTNTNDLMFNAAYLVAIKEIDSSNLMGSNFNWKTQTLEWSAYQGVLTYSEYLLSPMEVLQHEADHTSHYYQSPQDHINDSKANSDPQYDSIEERRVITGSEQNTAESLGKITEGEETRNDHFGIPVVVQDPFSGNMGQPIDHKYFLEETIVVPF